MGFADFFKPNKKKPANNAKDRLKLALVADRTGCSPEIMEQIKNDIISVLQKYVEIDQEGLDIKITQEEHEETGILGPALYANIPIKKVNR